MGSLRYRWGDSEPSAVLAQPSSGSLELYVVRAESTCVWRGDVTEVLQDWASWCAATVNDLQGGEGGAAARQLALEASRYARSVPGSAHCAALASGRAAAATIAARTPARDDPFTDNPFDDPEAEVQQEHVAELRRRLLHHVLADEHRGCIEPFEPEFVADALLGEVPRHVRFRWHPGVVQSAIDPIGRSDLEVLVGQSSVWRGDVHPILTSWAKRWVAAAAELWECPAAVAAFLTEVDGPDPREYGARVRGLIATLKERAPLSSDEPASLGHRAALDYLFGRNAYAAELAARCWALHGRRKLGQGDISTAIWDRKRIQFADLWQRVLRPLTRRLDWSTRTPTPTQEQVCAALLDSLP